MKHAADERAAGETPTGERAARERLTAEGAAEGSADEEPGEGAATEGTAGEEPPQRTRRSRIGDEATGRQRSAARADRRPRNRSRRAIRVEEAQAHRRQHRRIYIGAIAVLALGLATQAVLEFRDSLAAHVPATRPLLGAVCRAFGCTIDPLRDAAALSIDASDLQADPAHTADCCC